MSDGIPKPTVMIVDDVAFVRKLLTRQLETLGYTDIIACESAIKALERLSGDMDRIDAIFCDLQMPEMDGVEFVRNLGRIGYVGKLILLSGEDQRILQTVVTLAKAHKLNVLGALQKPVATSELKEMLDQGLGTADNAEGGQSKSYTVDELRNAIAFGDMVNYYQPVVDVRSGAVAGVETLVRWRHPQDGLIMPNQFIEMAETNGLVGDLTRRVLSEALQQVSLWRDGGTPLHVAVNVSMDTLDALEFPDFVADEVDQAGLPRSSVVLEVTESRLMRDPVAVLDILTRLRLKRIGLSIDDFGTGHSSLAQLRDIPFDELKIDRGFVHGAGRNPSLRAIFEANLGMARQLGLKTVAEGVEDRNDWDLVRELGCELAQGYFIARPMPANEFADWMAEWNIQLGSLVAN